VLDVTAQVSIYPLRQEQLGPAIAEAVACLKQVGLDVWEGAMSTLVAGDLDTVCTSLQHAFATAATHGEVVLVVTLSNACPVPAQRPDSA
jgi:uncharacterized protein YqgV (UPF0045/DUF77 family)